MNKENYKKAIDQIHPSEDLKQKTIEKITKKQKTKSNLKYLRFATACLATIMVCVVGQKYLEKNSFVAEIPIAITEKTKAELPRFESMEQLKKVLKENDSYRQTNGLETDVVYDGFISSGTTEDLKNAAQESLSEKQDFSTTNLQVQNVDEADYVKTDGNYIYYVSNDKILIIKADTLEIVFVIDENANKEEKQASFSVREIFIKDDILVALGNEYEYKVEKSQTTNSRYDVDGITKDVLLNYAGVAENEKAKAIIYDISDKTNPVLKREVCLSGNYSNSRMIGDYLYFISIQGVRYSTFLDDEEILPFYKDTNLNEDKNTINYSDIAYFEGTNNYSYTLIAGFNIKENEEISVETFFGANDTVYASEKNLYLAQVHYDRSYFTVDKSTIYKFSLEKGQVILNSKAEVEGNLNNQFSMDEYEGNLRIATTAYNIKEETTNQLYILDENLKEIGKIENLALGEKIYSVRFIGKMGYIVTFKEIDPLFVIDLSDPTNPQVKGELKIPGYSSYLHPYDETHIIGIGYNTKENGYGGITNSNMKMSMFDVSDVENPKEMFSVDIGEDYASSEITYNHKALFYHKNRNLIGFPVSFRDYSIGEYTNNLVLYKINLENGFEEYGTIKQRRNYKTNINRAIYIGNNLFTLSETQILSYNLDTMEKQNELNYEAKVNDYYMNYYNEIDF